ncbi:hypothetical protein J6590_080474 [Homalodisca vitripennis]|nr:hypothetical protein J6590_080474 [Homalodisca vitripennis]
MAALTRISNTLPKEILGIETKGNSRRGFYVHESHVTGGPIYFLRPTMQHVARNPGARQSSGPTSKYYSDHEGVAGMSSAYQSPLSLIVDPTN